MNFTAVIPAHLASIRFPRKILFPFFGLPMIEHVRRRALLSKKLNQVYVATCDIEIAEAVSKYGARVVMTRDSHINGMSRVAEAISQIECSHVILLQGDEPLMLPSQIDLMIEAVEQNPKGDAWNATGPIENNDELERHSFVKCCIGSSNRILLCFRRSPCFSDFSLQRDFIRKILGIIAFRKDFLLKLIKMEKTHFETSEFIEQMRILEYGFNLYSVNFSYSLPSVNEPHEADLVLKNINSNPEQKKVLNKILNMI